MRGRRDDIILDTLSLRTQGCKNIREIPGDANLELRKVRARAMGTSPGCRLKSVVEDGVLGSTHDKRAVGRGEDSERWKYRSRKPLKRRVDSKVSAIYLVEVILLEKISKLKD